MEFYINTDLTPIESGKPHSRDNWTSPDADKFNDGYDYLQELEMGGYYECYFDSKSQEFSPKHSTCKGLTEKQIGEITNKLNSL